MSHLTPLSGRVFQWVLQTTWQAAVLAGLILLAQWLLRKRLSPAWRYGLWMLLIVRLLMPVSPQSACSIFNLARSSAVPPATASPPSALFATMEVLPARKIPCEVPAAPEPHGATLMSPAPAIVKPAAKTDWFAVAFCGWLAGVCFFGARLVWTNGRFRSRISVYQPVADENALRLFNDCRAAFRITRPVRLIESDEVESPAVYGLWRKWLLLPDGVFERFSTEELRCIFLHELAHIKRGDLGVNWLVALLQVLHWFNPVLWLAWTRMRTDRELATDALALAHVRESDHSPYGETILKVLEGLTGESALPGLVGILENKADIKERLKAIGRAGKYWPWAALALAVALAIIGLTDARTEIPIPEIVAASKPTTSGHALAASWAIPMPLHVEYSGTPLKAVVLLPDGTPVAGADVACVTPVSIFDLHGRSFHHVDSQDQIIQTAHDGSFTIETEVAARAIVAAHQQGFAKVSLDSVRASGRITLQPWGRVEGVLHIGSRLGTNEEVGLEYIGFGLRYPARRSVRSNFHARTDGQGRFVIPDVPPGQVALGRVIYLNSNRSDWTYTADNNVVVKAGEPTEVEIGGVGRPVIGRATLDEAGKQVDWTTAFCTLTLKVPHPKFKTIKEVREWRWDSEDAPQSFYYHALAKADGTFQIDDVPPGNYYLYIEIRSENAGGGPRAQAAKEVTIAAPQGIGITSPFDLGTIPVKVLHPLRVGDMALPWRSKLWTATRCGWRTIGARMCCLFSGLRWQTRAQSASCEKSAGALAGDKRLAIITIMCQPDLDPALVKDAIKRMNLNCVHAVLGADFTANGLDNYNDGEGMPVPFIVLIDRDGKIAGKNLGPLELKDSVAKTLAKR